MKPTNWLIVLGALSFPCAALGSVGCRQPPPMVVRPRSGTTTGEALFSAGVAATLQGKYGCVMGGCGPGYECDEESGLCRPLEELNEPASPKVTGDQESCSSIARSSDGTLEIEGLDGSSIHHHGGPAALLESSTFRVRNLGDETVGVRVTAIDYLTTHECNEAPLHVRSSPRFLGFGPAPKPQASTVIGAREETELIVHFEPVEAAYAYCDRFAFRVSFEVQGEHLEAIAEIWVSREEE